MNHSVLDLVRPELRELQAYVAAEPDFDRLRLHANESPWDTDVSLACHALNRYPPVRALDLERRLAEVYGAAPGSVLATRGSDDGIDLLVRAFCRAGEDAVLTTPPTFGMYSVAARIQNAEHVAVPLDRSSGFALDATAVLAAASDAPVRIVFLCSPNNPTGNRLDPLAVAQLCEALRGQAVVVVDEAYAEYSADRSHVGDIASVENLVVLRTLSKAHGLAGVRCGAIVASPALIAVLASIAPPYSTPSPVIAAVLERLTPAALAETAARAQRAVQLREQLAERLAGLDFVRRVWPSDANFVLVDVDDAEGLVARCRERDLLIRHFPGKPGLEGSVRISVGTAAQQDQLVGVLEALA